MRLAKVYLLLFVIAAASALALFFRSSKPTEASSSLKNPTAELRLVRNYLTSQIDCGRTLAPQRNTCPKGKFIALEGKNENFTIVTQFDPKKDQGSSISNHFEVRAFCSNASRILIQVRKKNPQRLTTLTLVNPTTDWTFLFPDEASTPCNSQLTAKR